MFRWKKMNLGWSGKESLLGLYIIYLKEGSLQMGRIWSGEGRDNQSEEANPGLKSWWSENGLWDDIILTREENFWRVNVFNESVGLDSEMTFWWIILIYMSVVLRLLNFIY